MTIRELTNLRKEELSGKLRMPKTVFSVNDTKKLREINKAVEFLSRADRGSLLLLLKMVIKGFDGVKDLKGVGVENCPYEISTDFGSGAFYGAHECFDGGVYPKDIVGFQCFNNCYIAITKGYIKDCQILSGIAYRGGEKSFLHSVIKLEDKILDFNYNMCMDMDLYVKLFNFEVLSELDSTTLMKSYPVIRKHQRYLREKGFSTAYAVFAFEDLIDYLQNKNRRENEEVEIATM